MGYYKSLQRYYQNGCVLHPGKPPAWGEVNYKKYMQKQIFDLGIKPGDVIAVEERWHSGTSTNTKGTVLSIDNNRIWILTQGKKIWKDRSNQKNVLIEYITKINKLEDAGPDFNICEVDPDYKVESIMYEEESIHALEIRRTQKFQEKLSPKFPQIDVRKVFVLWMNFDFCWSYSSGKVKKAEIVIIKKNGDEISLPEFKLKHIYPNHTYYSTCGIQYTDEQKDGILLFFDSFEELDEIRLISCVWIVELDEEKMQFLQMVYPKFIRGEGNVYNLRCGCTAMKQYEESLYHHSVFSGMLEKEYNKAFVYISDTKGESIVNIMNANDLADEIVLDAVLCLNSNNSVQAEVAEVFIKNCQIKSKGYVTRY